MSDIIWTDIKQRTPEWVVWRDLGLGGSDIPVIMNVSPWRDAPTLFDEKKGLKAKDDMSYIQRLGDVAEAKIAPWLKENYDLDMKPICCERTGERSWQRVSLDGWDGGDIISEYKYASKKDHALVLSENRVPDKYWPQVQYQLYVTNAEKLIYVSYWEKGDDYAAVVVKPDYDYQKIIIERAKDFWDALHEGKKPIAPTKETEGDADWVKQAEITKLAKIKADEADLLYKDELVKLSKITKGMVTVGGGCRMTRTQGKTSVQWDKLEAISQAKNTVTKEDLEKITKIGKPGWRFTFLKEEK